MAAERLAEQGESVTPLIYQAAKRLREANAALEMLERGQPAKRGRGGAADASLRGEDAAAPARRALARARCGPPRARSPTSSGGRAAGPDYPERVALTLAVRRAAGARGSEAAQSEAPARTRAARAFLRAPVFRCSAPLPTALSIREQSVAMLGVGGLGIAGGDGGLEPSEMGLDGAGQAAVLVVLAQRPGVALSL